MAYTSCISAIAKNIALDCTNPIVGGYTGRGVLIPFENITGLVVDSSNPCKISAITMAENAKVAFIDNVFTEPFTGSSTASNADSGRVAFTKTIQFRIPLRGSDVSKNIVDPLAKSAAGFLLVLEKKDKVGDGSFEIIGAGTPFRANADGISRDESANGGDIQVIGSATEPYIEYDLVVAGSGSETTYTATKAYFETLVAKAF